MNAAAVIAPLQAQDVERVSALARRVWLAHYPGIISVAQIEYMLAQRYDPSVLRDELRRAALWWDVIPADGEIIGFASYFLADTATEMKLDKLYVDPAHQRRGHGGRLLARACCMAREQGCRAVVLAVNKRNATAIAAYRKHGFEVREAVVQDIGGGFVMDDYIMARQP